VEGAVSARSPQTLAAAGRSRLAAVLGGLVLALAAASVALSALIHRLSAGSIAVGGVVVLTFAGVGLLIARRRPGNPVGWIMIVFSLAYVLGAAASYYAVLYYRLGHRGLPLAPVALLLGTVQAPSFAVFPLAIVLFPDGQLTRRWRRVMWAYVVLAAVVLAVFFLAAAAAAIADHDVRVGPGGDLTTSGQLAGWLANPPGWFAVPVIGSILVIGFSFVGRQVLSWRGAEGDRRQQLKWLAFGAAVACASLILAAVLGVAALLAGLAVLPASIGVGMLMPLVPRWAGPGGDQGRPGRPLPGRQERPLPSSHISTVASMVSRRAGQAVSELACGTGVHRIRTVPAQGRDPSAAVFGLYLGFFAVCRGDTAPCAAAGNGRQPPAAKPRACRGRRGPWGERDAHLSTLWNIEPVITGPMFHRCAFFSSQRLPDPGRAWL